MTEPQRYRVVIYRGDSTTSVVYEDVKHCWMSAGNTMLTIAQYISSEGTIQYHDLKEGEVVPSGEPPRPIKLGPGITTAHRYIHWPREKFDWFKVERHY